MLQIHGEQISSEIEVSVFFGVIAINVTFGKERYRAVKKEGEFNKRELYRIDHNQKFMDGLSVVRGQELSHEVNNMINSALISNSIADELIRHLKHELESDINYSEFHNAMKINEINTAKVSRLISEMQPSQEISIAMLLMIAIAFIGCAVIAFI